MSNPLANEIQTRAFFLAQSADFVTFLDLLPLAKQIATYKHLPAATVAALVHLREQKHTTPGARAVLNRTLTSYCQRIKTQRALAARDLGVADHGRTARLIVGKKLRVVLQPQGSRWEMVGPEDPIWIPITETLENNQQVFCIQACAQGFATLVFKQTVLARHAPAQRGNSRRREETQVRLTLLVESAADAALFCC